MGRSQHIAKGRQVVLVNPTHEQTAERSGGSHFNIVVAELLRPSEGFELPVNGGLHVCGFRSLNVQSHAAGLAELQFFADIFLGLDTQLAREADLLKGGYSVFNSSYVFLQTSNVFLQHCYVAVELIYPVRQGSDHSAVLVDEQLQPLNLSPDESFSDELHIFLGQLRSGGHYSFDNGGFLSSCGCFQNGLFNPLSDQLFDLVHGRNFHFGLILQLVEIIADAIDQAEHSGFEIGHVAGESLDGDLVGADAGECLFVYILVNDNSLDNGGLDGFLLGCGCSSGLGSFDLSHQLSLNSVELRQEIHGCNLAFETLQSAGKYHSSLITGHHPGAAIGSIGIPFDQTGCG